MKFLKIGLPLIFFFGITSGFAQSSANINMVITNIESNEGSIMIGLYKNADSFLKEGFKYLKIPAQKGSIEATFKDIPTGEYAISFYHDIDSNEELNMRLGFIPVEPYGVSNNAKERFSAPKWEKAVFSVADQDVTQKMSF